MLFGDPYVFECPQCGNLIVTSVVFGSGACRCDKCSPNEFIRFDYVSKDAIEANQKKYRHLLKDYL